MKRRRKRKRRQSLRPPPLTEEAILGWADAFHERWGRWPNKTDGLIDGPLREIWRNLDQALRMGHRGLPGGSSLARLLAQRRGVRNRQALPPFRLPQILAWADAHYRRTGTWPTRHSGPISGTNGDNWMGVANALQLGLRGLSVGSSLAQLLAVHRGVRNLARIPPLTPAQILAWADAHHTRTGRWPVMASGPIREAPGESWMAVDSALRNGQRGLAGGSSLGRLLAEARGVRSLATVPPLTPPEILAWADAHHTRTGRWPRITSGPIRDAPGESWLAIESALRNGQRGLAGGSSLARLLAEHRGVRNQKDLPRLTVRQIVAWAKVYHRETGKWPGRSSGPIHGSSGETWSAIDWALFQGRRGLPGGSSLARLFAEHGKSR